jgi:hypothetical protein
VIDTRTETRPAPPHLEPRCPDCSVCGTETYVDAEGDFGCEPCGITWDHRDAYDSDGEWVDDTAEQCATTVAPYLNNTWIKDDDERKHKTYRCVLDAGHDNPGPESLVATTPHANPEMDSWGKGWR